MIEKSFVVAGRATFTVEPSAKSLEVAKGQMKPWYTFRVKYSKARGHYYIELLTGPENTKDYTYVGRLIPETGDVRLTGASKYSETSYPVRIARNVLARLWAGQGDIIAGQGWKVKSSSRCCRCGRKLTTPESLTRGIGPECIKFFA
jgi:hypothetical protein